MPTFALAALAALQLSLAAGDDRDFAERDRGPAKIDVSTYPKGQKESYALFVARCGQCHSVARAINSRFGAAEWKRYLKRMSRRMGDVLTDDETTRIYEFLKYYSSKQGID
jgi:hypothetical protein